MRSIAFPLVLLGAVTGCGERDGKTTDTLGAAIAAPALASGENRLTVPDGNIWYKISGTGSGAPVILLHGGPGFSSVYMKSLEALGDDRPVVRYDQLGSGKSDRMSDTSRA